MGRYKQQVALAAVVSAVLTVASCSVQHDKFKSEGATVSVAAKGVSIRSNKLGASIEVTAVSVLPRRGAKPCDVKVWVQTDVNGNGKIETGEKKYLYCGEGAFREFKKQRVRLQSSGPTESATIVVEARDCNNKLAAPERHMLGIDKDGVHRLSPERPRSYVLAGGALRDHFVAIYPSGDGSAQLGIGDLNARGGSLAKLARSKTTDFLAAAIVVDNVLVSILVGRDAVHARLPRLEGRIGRVRVVTFNRSLQRCADFRVGELHVG